MVRRLTRIVNVGRYSCGGEPAPDSQRLPPFTVIVLSVLCASLPLTAAILPEDRADALYHRYDGGGVVIDGPSILARKQIGKHVSVVGNYYVDSITSASHDVVTQGSPYTEFRNEYRLGMDYLHENTSINLTYSNSEESDYIADTYSFSVSHVMFGDLTTVSLGFTRGQDEVRQNVGNDTFTRGFADHYKFRYGLSQILTGNLIISANMEMMTDEGFLNNPYRQVVTTKSLCNPALENCKSNVSENYPKTRTSNTVSLLGKYYLPYRATITAEYRTYADTWDIGANMFRIGYTQPIKTHWMLDFFYRAYSQNAASFYSEAIVTENLPLYMASDKEMSTMTSSTLGFGVSYEFGENGFWVFDKGSVNANYSRINFDYADFSDKQDPAESPTSGQPYSFTADVFRFFVSVWY